MIRALLGASGQNVRQLAGYLHISEGQVSKRMNGAIPWRHTELVNIADFFGVTVGVLFRDPLQTLKTRSEKSERRLTLAASRPHPDRRYKSKGSPLLATT